MMCTCGVVRRAAVLWTEAFPGPNLRFPKLINSNRGELKSVIGDYQGAMEDYSKSILINPNNPITYYNRGVMKDYLGDYQGAIVDYSKSLEIDPSDVQVLMNRANSYGKVGDDESVCKDRKKAASLGGKVAANWLSSDSAYFCRNMPD